MEQNKFLKQIARRLEVLIALQLEASGGAEAARPVYKIRRLSSLGLGPPEIAAILGKPANYVRATLSRKKSVRRHEGE
jgi:hypothetical protein